MRLVEAAATLGLLLGTHAKPCRGAAASDLDILAGQHVIYSFPTSSTPPAELVNLTSAGLVGGVILFGVNVDANTAAAMDTLRRAYAASPAPALLKKTTGEAGAIKFFVSTDQEGGQVRRMKNDEPKLSAKQIGAAADPAAAGKAAGEGAAATLRKFNNNVNLAPVLGVYRAAGDFLDYYGRSFGNTSQAVVAAAVPFLTAQQAAGVAATAKHFPGLGAASHDANTDERPVTLDLSLEEIRRVDEAPYVAAIAAGVQLVMPSWAVYPALDAARPAGLSGKWLREELRGRLGFQGVTVSDAMEAGSLSAFGGAAETATLAAEAGMDLLLASARNVTQGEEIRKALVSGVSSGRLSRAQFDEATKRIAALRSRLWA
ncbi:Glycoside hydrolase, family 3 [Cordyceps fumosorosea ARSEF 2679]|uniref:Glycoside hydrolase, family 3 n=1 Tax=Cordyceps fumosorosea (strain ARSEF 2679) TaxID=1081104 RepID=A0A167Q5F5_CORFA|nr:Glycoside hydrolase, family 3 [Cordyceps fumosorosea ARSEF 2679]OAA57310.1 Glycoside hydrolase, family 3 [Cordyceps fumosorosea ARSEF 2679]